MVAAGDEPVTITANLLQQCETLRLGRNNLFDVVRLYAAIQVILTHGRAHLDWQLPDWVLYLASLPGVPLFFSISGFLVGLSWIRLRYAWPVYALHRGLRIFPGLWFCLACTALLLLVAGQGDFLFSTNGLIWLLGQATVLQFVNPEPLRDFGVGVVNGSLWTIPVELQFYIALPALLIMAAGAGNRVPTWLWLLISGGFSFGVWLVLPLLLAQAPLLGKLTQVSLIPHLFQFLLGLAVVPALAVFLSRRVVILLLLASALLILVMQIPGAPLRLFQPVLWAALPIGVGLIPWRLSHMPDLSYGLYLFHMPVINALLDAGHSGPQSGIPFFLAIVPLALTSWFAVEKPSLALKPRLQALLPHA
jgi:peptidoglycan/LPS O-acetylase OafA/YrhL